MLKKTVPVIGAFVLVIAAFAFWLFLPPDVPEVEVSGSDEAVERGRYLLHAGGCISCHGGVEDGSPLTGGVALESDFGTFYVPNITPDQATGIGNWNGQDFIRALRHGRKPDGGFYFPAFPYRSYAGLTDRDILDMAAYLMSQPAVASETKDHELVAWLSPWMMAGWNLLADITQPVPGQETDPLISRGEYLVRHLGHCGECHTPRNSLGIPDLDREFAGSEMGGQVIEAIDEEALADWTEEDVSMLLLIGILPDGEFIGGEMAEVVEHNTSRLTDADRKAIAAFLKRKR